MITLPGFRQTPLSAQKQNQIQELDMKPTTLVAALLTACVFMTSQVATALKIAKPEHVQGPVEALTKAHTRLVWVQDTSEASNDTFAKGRTLRLMGYDSRDGKGARPILKTVGNYSQPMLTPDGKEVVFTIRDKNLIYLVDFSGKNLRLMPKGYGYEVGADPTSGESYLIYGTKPARGKGTTYGTLRKAPLKNPEANKPLWDAWAVDANNFQVSRDGTRASSLFPWPDAGIANLANGSFSKRGRGCWTSFSPDNSYVLWIFDGAHRNLTLYPPGTEEPWVVPVDKAPGINGYEVYHPRWSNHPRFIVMTGPYMGESGDRARNNIRAGGKTVEIYIGRFAPDYRTIENWVQVTSNESGDFFPDAWIAGGEKANISDTLKLAAPVAAETATARSSVNDDVVFEWMSSISDNRITDANGKFVRESKIVEKGKTIFTPDYAMDLTDGWVEAPDSAKPLLEACKASNQITLEAIITTTRLDQQGPARIITFSQSPDARNVTLGQKGDKLMLRLRTPGSGKNGINPEVVVGTIKPNTPHHVVVTYRDGQTSCYIDGELQKQTAALKGGFADWEAARLILGDEVGGGRDWKGILQGVRIYSRSLPKSHVKQRYTAASKRIKKQKPRTTLTVTAVLDEITPAPAPTDIGNYTRCLVGYGYKVKGVKGGTIDGDRIAVYRWRILDRKVLPDSQKLGDTVTMQVEAREQHPQLKAERVIETLEDFELPTYIDVGKR